LFDYVIVGSGAGGATVAKELSNAHKKVLILEKGLEAKNFANKTYSIIPSAVEIWSTICVGGTTKVTMGNAVRSPNSSLSKFYESAERSLGVSQVPEKHIGKATRMLLDCSKDWIRMPKAIDFSKCKMCGRCAVGCPNDARWEASAYLNKAVKNGARLSTLNEVKKVLIKNNHVCGVETANGEQFESNTVILSAGGIETPRILMRSGVDGVGEGLFVDTYITVGGVKEGAALNKELGMALVMLRNGYLLSPHYSSFIMPYMASKGIKAKPEDILGLMVKIEDEPKGTVYLEKVSKTISEKDSALMERGRAEAKDILLQAGVEKDSIVSTYYRGAHPGGTCSKAVNESFETSVEGLYISDASVIKGPFGLPPMLTIIANAEKFSSLLKE
jgi:choline dehydrogenase-like flavoprotein